MAIRSVAKSNPEEWASICALHGIKDRVNLAQLERRLTKVVSEHKGRLHRLDFAKESATREILISLRDAIVSLELFRASLPELGAATVKSLLSYLSATGPFGSVRGKLSYGDLDRTLRSMERDLLLLQNALTRATGVMLEKPTHRPRLPYAAPAAGLVLLWKDFTGKWPTSNPKTIKVKGKKWNANNESPSIHFVFWGLRMIDPDIRSDQSRTSVKKALLIVKSEKFSQLMSSNGPASEMLRSAIGGSVRFKNRNIDSSVGKKSLK